MKRRPSRPLLALALGIAVGCGGGVERPRNVVLISVDTLRPDLLGCYGSARPTSPHLDALARDGVLFETVVATSPWTLPSHASLLTGLYPNRHGARKPQESVPPDVVRWAVWMQQNGFSTAAVVNSHHVSE